ncbi:enoyl-ACP reductase FabI [Caenispirillum salinarum]|uniref:enoyl-ACP reductase FabI n=1 Tax=Caenispirillum salinarum TaxID=859058 RepID=UPI00384AF735
MTTFSLAGKKGLVIGIANDQSIAWGCAQQFREAGADLAVSYLNDKAKPYVAPLAERLDADLLGPCDVRQSGQMRAVFDAVKEKWGKLDFVLHSIAFAPKEDLHGRVVDCSRDGFAQAMDVSCHSFIRVAQYAEPLMTDGGSLLTVSFYGSEKVVTDYNIMGPVKAALESVTRYMAADLGEKGIRVNALSPGPLKTRAASGIQRFDALMEKAAERAPQHTLVTIEEIGAYANFLVSDGARTVTGGVHYVDAGYNIIG